MGIIEKIFLIIICHLIGDYVLQSDFIATTKADNWYHLIVHSFLYTAPFYFLGGWCWQLALICLSHILVDALKARYKKIGYVTDQVIHYIVALSLLIQ